jgi:hypothetical protein
MKKRISLIAALMVMFAMTAVSFAANTANINVTSEPITYHALCDKAGGISLSFDNNTTFVAGDQITADLPLNVSLCKDIDFVIGFTPGAGDATPFTAATDFGAGAPGDLPAIGTVDEGPITGQGTIISGGAGVAFWVHGSKGSQRVFIDVVTDDDGDDFLELGVTPANFITFVEAAPGNKMVISLLDQTVYTSPSNLYTDGTLASGLNGASPFYDTALVSGAENTLCINVSLYDNEYVKLSFDSKNDKFTWVPSDPQVAHVVAAQNIAFAPCAKRICGKIVDPTPADQGGVDICPVIINEGGINAAGTGYATGADGYCANTHRNNRVIIQETTGAAFAAGNYQIQLEIMVNGVGGDQGAYFANAIGAEAFTNATDACVNTAVSVPLATTGYDALGAAIALPGGDTDCSIAAADRVIKVISDEVSLFNGTDEDFLWVDIPNIIWDKTLFTDGENLSVKVTLIKSPCGTIFTGDWCVGTLGCDDGNSDTCAEYMRVYPYFGKNAPYLNIFGITNTSPTDNTYAVTIYEKDGDVFTSSVAVGSHKISAVLLHSLTVATASNAGGGTFGDEQSYVTVQGPVGFEGIIYVTNSVTGQSFSGSPSGYQGPIPVPCP